MGMLIEKTNKNYSNTKEKKNMKAMSKIATKIAGVALATVMAVGGMSVFAAETGDQVYSENLYVTAERESIWDSFDYIGSTTTMTVPEDGFYTISLSSDHDEDSYKSIRIYDSNGRIPLDSSGYWESTSYSGIDLYAGVEYTIEAYAKDFMGWTFAYDGIEVINVSLTLTEKIEDEVVPEVIDEPEIIEEPEEVEISEVIAAAEPAEIAVPAIPRLTVEQIRAMSIRNFVGHLYLEGLGRNISVEETNYWVDMMLNQDVSATEAATMILTSSEITDREMTDEEYASILNDVFDTDSEEEILSQLNYGASVQTVIEDLAGTDEWTSKCAFYGVNV